MQYFKCKDCMHKGNVCQMIMAQAIVSFSHLRELIDYSQTRNTEHKCDLKIDLSCENYTPKKVEDLINE